MNITDELLRFDDVRLATGIRLHWAEGGDPTGEPVVFLHGWPDSWYSFSRVLPLLPRRIRAIAVDQRGFGDSERPVAGCSIPDLASDVVALLDALAIDRATLVGHSFGSFVARAVALARPDRVERLALIGSGFARASPVLHELQAGLRDLPDPVPADFAREFQASTVHHPVPEAFFDRIVAESLKLPARLWRGLIDALVAHDDEAELGALTTATLIIWGEKDALFPRGDQLRLAAALPRAVLSIHEDTGHCPNWERPERVAAEITALVEGAAHC